MSNKSQYEDHGLGSCYKTLTDSWKYSCPHKNINFSGFSGGVNCLCSSGDQAQIEGKKWPIANPILGWKK